MCIETRTSLHPFVGSNAPVVIAIVAQVAMADYTRLWVQVSQFHQQTPQGGFLLRSSRIGRLSRRIQTSLVADTYTNVSSI